MPKENEQRFLDWVPRLQEGIARFPGLLAFKVVEPQTGIQDEFVVMNRWASAADLARWEDSDERSQLFAEVERLCSTCAHVQHVVGMQAVFTLPGTDLSVAPAKYKMALIIFSGLFVLTLFWTTLGSGLISALPVVVRIALIVAVNVLIMVYFYLPFSTRALLRWLNH